MNNYILFQIIFYVLCIGSVYMLFKQKRLFNKQLNEILNPYLDAYLDGERDSIKQMPNSISILMHMMLLYTVLCYTSVAVLTYKLILIISETIL